MKVGARNRITGTVSNITKGTVMCLVKVETFEKHKCAEAPHQDR